MRLGVVTVNSVEPPAGDLEPGSRVWKRLSVLGEIDGPLIACRWRGKPAAFACLESGLGLGSLARTASMTCDSAWEHVAVSGQGASRKVLFVQNPEVVEFVDAAAALAFDRLVARHREQHYQANLARQPLRVKAGDAIVRSLTYLGGTYLPLAVRGEYDLAARSTSIDIFAHPATGASEPLTSLPLSRSLAVEIGGPGEEVRGGGWAGGGSGFDAALEGAALASILNSLTSKRTITTIVHIADQRGEGFFLCSNVRPDELRLRLSPLFVRLRSLHIGNADGAQEPPVAADDIISRLERLTALHRSGALTAQEFETGKTAILRGM